MPKLRLHIGMPKSGSTFLQQHIFPKVSMGSELNVHGEKKDSVKVVFDALKVKQEKGLNAGEIRILSNESLCGLWHRGVKFSGWECFRAFVSECKKMESGSVLLFVLRDLRSYSWAMYLDQLKKGKIKKGYGEFLSQFSYEDLSIEKRLTEMQDLNSIVLWHKDLIEEQEAALSVIANFSGASNFDFGDLGGMTSNLTPKKDISIFAHRYFCKISTYIERFEKCINEGSYRLVGKRYIPEHYIARKNRRDALTRKIENLPFGKALRREKAPDEWEAFFSSDMSKSKIILETLFQSRQI
jgi:hypothetical protein